MSETQPVETPKKRGRPPKVKEPEVIQDESDQQEEPEEVEIIFESDKRVMARIERQLPIYVKALGYGEHKGHYVVDPYSGKKLTGKFESQGEAAVALKKLKDHEDAVFRRTHENM